MAGNKRGREDGAGGCAAGTRRGQPPPGRNLTDADILAVVAALVPGSRVGRTLTDADVEEIAMRTASAFFNDERVQTVLFGPVASAFDVAGAMDDALKAGEERKPSLAEASSAMADALMPEMETCLAAARGGAGTYDTWSTNRLRTEINQHMPTRTMRAVDAESFMERVRIVSLDERYGGDLWTFLVAPSRATEDSNAFPRLGADRLVYAAIKNFLLRLAGRKETVPEVFRDWVTVNVSDPSPRHHCVIAHVRNGQHDGRSDGRRLLYKLLLYFMLPVGENGVSFKMLHPSTEAPQHAQAAGHSFFSCEKTLLTCPSGNLTAIDERKHVLVTCGCLVKDAVAIAAAFLRVGTKLGSAIDAAVVTSLKTIVTDDTFNWKGGGHPDHVGARQ